MKHFFVDKKAYALFLSLVQKLNGESKSEFYGLVNEAYKNKQVSEDELPTFSLTSEEVQTIFHTIEQETN